MRRKGRFSDSTYVRNIIKFWPLLKVSKSQNNFMKSSFLPKYERNILRISALKVYIDWVLKFVGRGFESRCSRKVFFIFLLFFFTLNFSLVRAKGQLILKGLYGFFSSPKKWTKNFCSSSLGQKLTFSSSFFGRIEDTKISFRD